MVCTMEPESAPLAPVENIHIPEPEENWDDVSPEGKNSIFTCSLTLLDSKYLAFYVKVKVLAFLLVLGSCEYF